MFADGKDDLEGAGGERDGGGTSDAKTDACRGERTRQLAATVVPTPNQSQALVTSKAFGGTYPLPPTPESYQDEPILRVPAEGPRID